MPQIITELFYDGVWNDISADAYDRQVVSITRGRPDEAGAVDRGSCLLQLNNRSGKYSPRNPTSPLYGKIGRNTPIRVRVPSTLAGLRLTGGASSYASTPDTAALDITGDLEVGAEITPDTWRPASNTLIAAKYRVLDGARSWTLRLLTDGRLILNWTTDGTFSTVKTAESTAAVPSSSGRVAVWATIDVDNGASGNTVRFYTATSISGARTQLGNDVVQTGTTSIFAGTADLTAGSGHAGNTLFSGDARFSGVMHAIELRNGLGGTAVANPDFATQEPRATSFTDLAGRAWTVQSDAVIERPDIRFSGEVSSWPSRWDLSGSDVWVPIEASGILRRLGQGATPLRSAMYRGLTGGNFPTPKAYWPCEDAAGSTVLASGLSGGTPMSITGSVTLANYSGFAASAPLPTLTTGTLVGRVPTYTQTNYLRVMALVSVPSGGVSATTTLMKVNTRGGSSLTWWLDIDTGGLLRLRATDTNDTEVVNSGFVTFNANGKDHALGIYLVQNGSNIDWQIFEYAVGASSVLVSEGTLTGKTIGTASTVTIRPDGNLNGGAVGHVVVMDHSQFWDMLNFINAWKGETAADRISRLCGEQGVPIRIRGVASESAKVGAQPPEEFLELVRQAADADLGVQGEQRDAAGLDYRVRASLYNQQVALSLDYSQGHISAPFEPIDDDQLIRNDITVERIAGSSARAVLETGPLSILEPPGGVGRYDESLTLSLDSDSQVRTQAEWRLHLGTVDQERYPTVHLDLATTHLASKVNEIFALDAGDRIQITNTPAWLPPGPVDLIVQGYTETIELIRHDIGLVCTPALPWIVGVVEDATRGRADTVGSQLASGATSTATSLSVSTTTGPVWSTDAAQFPFDIVVGGEVMRVTNITGASSPQTFTVTRSINGIVKTHAANAAVALVQAAVAAL